MTTVQTLDTVRIIDTPTITVYAADVLAETEFTTVDIAGVNPAEIPYLWVNRLRIMAAPQVDTCEMQFEYGRKLNPLSGQFELVEPLEIVDQFVKVVIGKTLDTDKEIIWYGRIKHESKQVFGAGANQDEPAGMQFFTAFGLLHLLDEHFNLGSVLYDNTSTTTFVEEKTIQGAIPFNLDPGGVYPETGNRSQFDHDGCYLFSLGPRSKYKWNAAQAVEYLLKHHVPLKSDGESAVKWKLIAPVDSPERSYLEWYEVSVDRELRTTKEILDELINRKRGVGYFVKFDPADPDDPDDEDSIGVYLFNGTKDDITLSATTTLKGNQNQFSLDFENAFDVVESTVSDVATNAFTHVRVFGEYMTVTFTNKMTNNFFDPDEPDDPTNMFVRGWTDDQAEKFNKAASINDDGTPNDTYAEQSPEVQAAWNAFARNSDKLSNVYRRYMINPDWDQLCTGPHDGESETYYAFPVISEDPTHIDDYEHSDDPDVEAERKETVENRRIKILPYLVLKDQNDYSGTKIPDEEFEDDDPEEFVIPQHIPTMVYAHVSGSGQEVRDDDGELVDNPPRYELVDRLNYGAFDDDRGRRWGCSVACPSDGPFLNVSAHPPQMIATTDFSVDDAETAESQQPSSNNGLNWHDDLFVTLTCQHPRRLQRTIEIETPDDGVPRNQCRIYVPRARCDYVHAYTTFAIDKGIPIVTTSGGFVKDDRQRISDIARAAAEWYGQKRKTLNLTLKQCRNIVQLGWLITDIGANLSPTAIHTPVTAVEYNFPPGNQAPFMRIETNYHDLDFT